LYADQIQRGVQQSEEGKKKRKTWKETGRETEREREGFYSIQMFSVVETASLQWW